MSKTIRIKTIEQLKEGMTKGLKLGSCSEDTPYGEEGYMYAERETYLVFMENGKGTLQQGLDFFKNHGATDYSTYPIY